MLIPIWCQSGKNHRDTKTTKGKERCKVLPIRCRIGIRHCAIVHAPLSILHSLGWRATRRSGAGYVTRGRHSAKMHCEQARDCDTGSVAQSALCGLLRKYNEVMSCYNRTKEMI
jgi:hypothetical protein